jgi:molybdate transport system regulatory protein
MQAAAYRPPVYNACTPECRFRADATPSDFRFEMKKRTTSPAQPRLRVLLGAVIAIGPGKADLLEGIAATGSISAAARRLGMSYRRAWLLVDVMNRCFRTPLVTTAKGGTAGGGAALTPLGKEVLRRYRAMEARAARAIAGDLAKFRSLMRKRPAASSP